MASSELISLINNLEHVFDSMNKLIICFVPAKLFLRSLIKTTNKFVFILLLCAIVLSPTKQKAFFSSFSCHTSTRMMIEIKTGLLSSFWLALKDSSKAAWRQSWKAFLRDVCGGGGGKAKHVKPFRNFTSSGRHSWNFLLIYFALSACCLGWIISCAAEGCWLIQQQFIMLCLGRLWAGWSSEGFSSWTFYYIFDNSRSTAPDHSSAVSRILKHVLVHLIKLNFFPSRASCFHPECYKNS